MSEAAPAIEFELVPQFQAPPSREPALIVPLMIGSDLAWDMLPYPAARQSVISRQTYHDMTRFPNAFERRGNRVLLRELLIAGRRVHDLEVAFSLAPSRLGVDGFLGLDFFEQFEVVEWRPRARLIRLLPS